MKIYEEFAYYEKNSFLNYVKETMFDEAYNFASWLNDKGKLEEFMDMFDEIDFYSLQDYLIYYQDENCEILNLEEEYEKDYLNFK